MHEITKWHFNGWKGISNGLLCDNVISWLKNPSNDDLIRLSMTMGSLRISTDRMKIPLLIKS
jgi:hypothetical protein